MFNLVLNIKIKIDLNLQHLLHRYLVILVWMAFQLI